MLAYLVLSLVSLDRVAWEVVRKVARLRSWRFMVSVSQFPLSVIAIFICRVLIWFVFQFFSGVIVNSRCDMEEELRWFFAYLFGFSHWFRLLVSLGRSFGSGRAWSLDGLLGKNSAVAWKVARFGRFMNVEKSVPPFCHCHVRVGFADSLGRTGESSGSSLDQLGRHRARQNDYSEGTRSL